MRDTKFIIMAIILCLGFAGCSSDSDGAEEINTHDEIIGKWVTTSYYTSGGYFVPSNDGEFYDFKTDKTCVYYSGNILETYDYYDFAYSQASKTIGCKHSKGWDLNIKVEFENEDEAVFYITGKTSNSNKTIKVKRN